MFRFFFLLCVLAGIGYAGLHVYYGAVVSAEIAHALKARGLGALEVEALGYSLLAPVTSGAELEVTLGYRASQAKLDMTLQGHPLATEPMQFQFDGLQALRLGIGLQQ